MSPSASPRPSIRRCSFDSTRRLWPWSNRAHAASTQPIRRVTPVAGPDGHLKNVAVDVDRKGDSLRGRRTLSVNPLLQIGVADAHLAWAPMNREVAGELWPLRSRRRCGSVARRAFHDESAVGRHRFPVGGSGVAGRRARQGKPRGQRPALSRGRPGADGRVTCLGCQRRRRAHGLGRPRVVRRPVATSVGPLQRGRRAVDPAHVHGTRRWQR